MHWPFALCWVPSSSPRFPLASRQSRRKRASGALALEQDPHDPDFRVRRQQRKRRCPRRASAPRESAASLPAPQQACCSAGCLFPATPQTPPSAEAFQRQASDHSLDQSFTSNTPISRELLEFLPLNHRPVETLTDSSECGVLLDSMPPTWLLIRRNPTHPDTRPWSGELIGAMLPATTVRGSISFEVIALSVRTENCLVAHHVSCIDVVNSGESKRFPRDLGADPQLATIMSYGHLPAQSGDWHTGLSMWPSENYARALRRALDGRRGLRTLLGVRGFHQHHHHLAHMRVGDWRLDRSLGYYGLHHAEPGALLLVAYRCRHAKKPHSWPSTLRALRDYFSWACGGIRYCPNPESNGGHYSIPCTSIYRGRERRASRGSGTFNGPALRCPAPRLRDATRVFQLQLLTLLFLAMSLGGAGDLQGSAITYVHAVMATNLLEHLWHIYCAKIIRGHLNFRRDGSGEKIHSTFQNIPGRRWRAPPASSRSPGMISSGRENGRDSVLNFVIPKEVGTATGFSEP
ncbi:hypothetical protein B0H11DRAFT_2435408 [Mycena galericulata]|nr:hypothetical protein B0H11DRAFT_2435408 [Mycena galericulata]